MLQSHSMEHKYSQLTGDVEDPSTDEEEDETIEMDRT